MNICIVVGKIVSQKEFKFIINSKNKSIVYFDLELSNKSIIKVKAYDEIADNVYSKIRDGEILICGKLCDNGSIEIKDIFRVNGVSNL